MQHIKLGTRHSPLALKQAQIVAGALQKAYPQLSVELYPLKSEGDLKPNTPLSELGGKGIFVKAIEMALLEKKCDLAIHSFKDITSTQPTSLCLAGFLKPDVITDCLVLPKGSTAASLADLKPGAIMGTSSLRRRALISRLRPDIQFKDIRGNVETRLQKCDDGLYDAILLSEAGLVRLGLDDRKSDSLNPNTFYPAPGQGIIAIQARKEDTQLLEYCEQLTPHDQGIISRAEYAFMSAIGLGCDFPLAMHTTLSDHVLSTTVYLKYKNGKEETVELTVPQESAEAQLAQLGQTLKEKCQ